MKKLNVDGIKEIPGVVDNISNSLIKKESTPPSSNVAEMEQKKQQDASIRRRDSKLAFKTVDTIQNKVEVESKMVHTC